MWEGFVVIECGISCCVCVSDGYGERSIRWWVGGSLWGGVGSVEIRALYVVGVV